MYYIVTGASGSMGCEAVKALVAQGHTVVMAVRNTDKGEMMRKRLLEEQPQANIIVRRLDLSSFQSVRDFAQKTLDETAEKGEKIDGLFNNAGIINRSHILTTDRYENTLQVNYLSPTLLTLLLLPQIAEEGHIVNMVSLTCRYGKIDHQFFDKHYHDFSQLGTYSNTKLALLLISIAMHDHRSEIGAEKVHINVSDPGIVNSNMITMHRWFDPLADLLVRPFFRSPQKGVAPALRALTTDEEMHLFKGQKGSQRIETHYLKHPMLNWLWQETMERIYSTH